MKDKEFIELIEKKIREKVKNYRESWNGIFNQNVITKRALMEGEIKALKDLRNELKMRNGERDLSDPFPLVEKNKFSFKFDTSDPAIWQVFTFPKSMNGEDLSNEPIVLYYNKKTTDYYVEYKGDIIIATTSEPYWKFKTLGTTWRYRDRMNRVELSRGLEMVAYYITDKIRERFSRTKIKRIHISAFLKMFSNWLFINEVPPACQSEEWKLKVKLLKKEGK